MLLLVCGLIPLLAWNVYGRGIWREFFLQGYLLTGFLFGLLLLPEYPDFLSKWWWKSMLPITALHGAILFALLKVNVEGTPLGLKLPAVTIYSLLSAVLIGEWSVSVRIIRALEPHRD
jgi:hypothetical protein